MTEPLDMSKDPDRFATGGMPQVGPLDPLKDPDRFDPHPGSTSGEGQTLPGMLGEGAQEGERDTWTWLFGLLGILAFLLLFTLLVQLR